MSSGRDNTQKNVDGCTPPPSYPDVVEINEGASLNNAFADNDMNDCVEMDEITTPCTDTGQRRSSLRNAQSNPELSSESNNNNDIRIRISEDGRDGLSKSESDHCGKNNYTDPDVMGNGMDNPTFSISLEDLSDNDVIRTPMDSTHNVMAGLSKYQKELTIKVENIDVLSSSGFSSNGLADSPVATCSDLTPNNQENTNHNRGGTGVGLSSMRRRGWSNTDFISLMYSHHKKVELKDFTREIRAQLDVENFINRAVLLLDLHENSLEKIIDAMLLKMNLHDPDCDIIAAKNALYTANSSVPILAQTIQGTCPFEGETVDFDQQWICTVSSVPSVQRRHVGIARLHHPANLGHTSQEVHFVILVLAPTKEKGTKNAVETGRTFATMLTGLEFRQKLMSVHTEDEFKQALREEQKLLTTIQKLKRNQSSGKLENPFENQQEEKDICWFGRGVRMDLKRRLPHYLSDFTDGVTGHRTIQKLLSTILFLYFAIILPGIAFGVLNFENTDGSIGVTKVLMSQAFGGIVFSLIGGQPLIILLTTAPLAIYTKVIKSISDEMNTDFYSMYACVGIWNAFFLIIYSLSNSSSLMKYSTRSTEEIFALFISVAFSVDAFKSIYYNFHTHYFSEACETASSIIYNSTNELATAASDTDEECHRDTSLLYLILMFGTLWVGTYLYNFTKSPFLDARKREMLADYSLPVAVLLLSFFGSYLLSDVPVDKFTYQPLGMPEIVTMKGMSISAVMISMGLGFCLSLLFYMDQNISSAMVNNPVNKLKKGPAYHWDLFVIAIINGLLSLFGMPWVHAALPHSPLHVRALADVEERVIQGHVYDVIVHVRETRLTTLVSHIMIGLSLLMLPVPLQYIPIPVLYGLFLYVAVTALNGNEMFDRIMLLLTEQSAYPPNHYIRRVPQRKVHLFTGTQLLQLVALCALGFSSLPYLKMVFPVILMLFIPIRMKLIPMMFQKKYLRALDGH